MSVNQDYFVAGSYESGTCRLSDKRTMCAYSGTVTDDKQLRNQEYDRMENSNGAASDKCLMKSHIQENAQ